MPTFQSIETNQPISIRPIYTWRLDENLRISLYHSALSNNLSIKLISQNSPPFHHMLSPLSLSLFPTDLLHSEEDCSKALASFCEKFLYPKLINTNIGQQVIELRMRGLVAGGCFVSKAKIKRYSTWKEPLDVSKKEEFEKWASDKIKEHFSSEDLKGPNDKKFFMSISQIIFENRYIDTLNVKKEALEKQVLRIIKQYESSLIREFIEKTTIKEKKIDTSDSSDLSDFRIFIEDYSPAISRKLLIYGYFYKIYFISPTQAELIEKVIDLWLEQARFTFENILERSMKLPYSNKDEKEKMKQQLESILDLGVNKDDALEPNEANYKKFLELLGKLTNIRSGKIDEDLVIRIKQKFSGDLFGHFCSIWNHRKSKPISLKNKFIDLCKHKNLKVLTDLEAQWYTFSFKESKIKVLRKLNLLEHSPATLVELYNYLHKSLDSESPKQETKNVQSIAKSIADIETKTPANPQNIKTSKTKQTSQDSRMKDDIYAVIKSLLSSYAEGSNTFDKSDFQSLSPLAFVNDPMIYSQYLDAVCTDIRDDVIFNTYKIEGLTNILTGVLVQEKVKEFINGNSLLACLEILERKFQSLTITTENIEIQAAMDCLMDIFYLMSIMGVSGVSDAQKERFLGLTDLMKTHKLEIIVNTITIRGRNPSLEFKREYLVEALKRIGSTNFEDWQSKWDKGSQLMSTFMESGLKALKGDISCISEIMKQLVTVSDVLNGEKSWFDHVNDLRQYSGEPFDVIKEKVLMNPKSKDNYYAFFTCELLFKMLRNKLLGAKEHKKILDGFVTICDKKSKESKVKANIDVRKYIKQSLGQLYLYFDSQVRNILVDNLDIIAEIDSEKSSIYIKNENIFGATSTQPSEEKQNSQILYQKRLRKMAPIQSILSQIQMNSQKTFEFPKIYIKQSGINKNLEFDKKLDDIFNDCLDSLENMGELSDFKEKLKNEFNQENEYKIDMLNHFLREFMEIKNAERKKKDGLKENQLRSQLHAKKKPNDLSLSNSAKIKKGNNLMELLKNKNDFKRDINEEYKKFSMEDLSEIFFKFRNDDKLKVLVIQGEAGSGKTLFLKMMESKMWQEYNGLRTIEGTDVIRIPIRITLSEIRNLSGAVEEFFRKMGCTFEDINSLKKKPMIIFFDGYDEISQPLNLYLTNNLDQWKAKMVLTSRRDYINSLGKDESLLFSPSGKKEDNNFRTIMIQPLNEEQRGNYFKMIARENMKRLDILKSKKAQIEKGQDIDSQGNSLEAEINNLCPYVDAQNYLNISERFSDIISSPLMLTILVESLPNVKNKANLTKAELYSIFTNSHFERERDKLYRLGELPKKFNAIESFKEYSKDLAINMFMKEKLSINVNSNSYKKVGIVDLKEESPWFRFFNNSDEMIKYARRGAQLIEEEDVVRFYHKTIMEYFAALEIFEDILHYNEESNIKSYSIFNGYLFNKTGEVATFLRDMMNTAEGSVHRETGAKISEDHLTIFDKKLLKIIKNETETNNFLKTNIFLFVLMRPRVLEYIFHNEAEDSKQLIKNQIKSLFEPNPDDDFTLHTQIDYLNNGDRSIKKSFRFCLSIYLDSKPIAHSADTKYLEFYLPDPFSDKRSIDKNNTLKAEIISKFVFGTFYSIAIISSRPKEEASKKTFDYILSPTFKTENPYEFLKIKDLKEIERKHKWIVRHGEKTHIYPIIDPMSEFEINPNSWVNSSDICTIDQFAKKFIHKKFFICDECSEKKNSTIYLCEACRSKCHKGHNYTRIGKVSAYCDCRFFGCCSITQGCSSKFGEPETMYVTVDEPEKRNLCYHCFKNDCNKGSKDLIKPTTVQYEKCECNCVSSNIDLFVGTEKTNQAEDYTNKLDNEKKKFEDFMNKISEILKKQVNPEQQDLEEPEEEVEMQTDEDDNSEENDDVANLQKEGESKNEEKVQAETIQAEPNKTDAKLEVLAKEEQKIDEKKAAIAGDMSVNEVKISENLKRQGTKKEEKNVEENPEKIETNEKKNNETLKKQATKIESSKDEKIIVKMEENENKKAEPPKRQGTKIEDKKGGVKIENEESNDALKRQGTRKEDKKVESLENDEKKIGNKKGNFEKKDIQTDENEVYYLEENKNEGILSEESERAKLINNGQNAESNEQKNIKKQNFLEDTESSPLSLDKKFELDSAKSVDNHRLNSILRLL